MLRRPNVPKASTGKPASTSSKNDNEGHDDRKPQRDVASEEVVLQYLLGVRKLQ
jgi:hypothetical protein